jgi:hypothetical protein
MSEGSALGWPGWTWGALVAVLPLSGLLGAHQSTTERRGRVPLVPPSVLGLPQLRTGLLIAVLFFTGFGGFMFAFSLALQVGLPGAAGLSALACGLALLPFAAGFLLASVAGPRVEARLGARVIALGSAVEAVGFAALAASVAVAWPEVTPLRLAPAMLVAGVGQGLVMIPLFGVVLRTVPVSQAGLGSGILITTQQTCLALGAATVGTGFLELAARYDVGTAFVLVAGGVSVASLVVLALSLRLAPDA